MARRTKNSAADGTGEREKGARTKAKTRATRGRATRADGRATRARILKAAKSMFAAGGFEATSLRQIAGAADVDLATLKYHFGSKADLFGDVYKDGHAAFLVVLRPFLESTVTVNTVDEVREAIATLAGDAAEFIYGHEWFVRLFLYRILEDASEISGLEQELEGIAIGLIDSGLNALTERGLLRPIDVKALISFLVSGVAMWVVAGRHKPHWLGEPHLLSAEGRERFESFLEELLLRLLVE